MAKGNYTGIKRVYERSYGGFLSTFSLGGAAPLTEEIVSELGETWQTLNIAVKPYACMAGLHSTIDCFNELQLKVNPTNIQSVSIELGKGAFDHGGWEPEYPFTVTGAQMNVRFIAATCILDGHIDPRRFSPQLINRQEIWDLISKINVLHQPDFDKDKNSYLTSRVKVVMNDEQKVETEVDKPTGVKQALTNVQIREKFRKLTKDIISEERQQSIEEAVLSLDSSSDLSTLLNLLKPTVKNILS
ncbi:unnamed protein product [Didymodactylos carnosus]|uniref:MmgE/PrpD C-terminal domain-containing protein n=1 Tax=Didymodactylos carnosus TaxID=1234261 RepID=A0A816CE26_9BILA|nr:unnamed protein product [Didymodactylos carnosus]CAF4507970.1 unnamed protein product [Didymodactylos carnosus]